MYKVILVDDEYMILEGLKRLIPWEELGFSIVLTAKRGQDVLTYMTSHPVDLVITDVSMPEMSGIEMIKEIRQRKFACFTIILSGYQEFSYVKQGLELGIQGYLVKPIDKKELANQVVQIKSKIEEREQLAKQHQLYQESVINHWLNDELNETEFIRFMTAINQTVLGPYIVVLIRQTYADQVVADFCQLYDQCLLVTRKEQLEQQTILVYRGNWLSLYPFIDQMTQEQADNIIQIIVGEKVEEWETVYESFEKVKKLLLFETFYQTGKKILSLLSNEADLKIEPKPSFISFNRALMIGDRQMILNELKTIFNQMEDDQLLPENVRYIAFLLFTDMYRQFPILSEHLYESTLQKIANSRHISQLRMWLFHVFKLVSDSSIDNQRYSETVKKVMILITEEYQHDLTLKRVANQLHINVVYLGQLFKKETERSFAQFLNQIRIKKAQQLLNHTDKTVNQIAEAVGYNNPNYFSKMFRKLNGLTPKEFRDTYRETNWSWAKE